MKNPKEESKEINVGVDAYVNMANKYVEEGDLIKALSLFYTAYNFNQYNFQIILDIARIYADMGLFELSNKFLFRYMDKSPSSFISKAYEELGINYFYLDNLWASGYYFHKKLKEDGYCNVENIDPEIVEFLNGSADKKKGYFIAYPFDRADYSERIKSGKRALSAGEYLSASLIYSSIPKEVMDEETEGDLALSCFLSGLDEKMKEACKDSLTRHGENVTAFCNLSNYYRDKGDLEKSKYYFEKALTVRKGKEDEPYKLATCAVELGYHEIASECLKKILDERPYDDVMNFFHGISYLNLGKYSLGLEALTKAYAINREDLVYKYYVDLASDLIENKESARKQLPLRYQKDYPDSVSTRYKRIIKATVKGDMPKKLKEDELLDILKWGIYNSSFSTQRDSVCIAGTMLGKKGSSLLKEALISPNLRDEIKKLSLMTLITSGCKDKISVLARVFFVKVKLRKTLFSGTEDERLYLPAYALAITTAVYSGIEEYEKIGFSANKLYKKYNGLIKEQGYTNEEIATLIICLAGIEKIKSDKDICKNFSVEEKKIRKVLNLIRGEEDDKND